MADGGYEIIGTRANSAFRVNLGYFRTKRDRFQPKIDPTTGGPVAVVYAGTDELVPLELVHWVMDPHDDDFGAVYVDRPRDKAIADKAPKGGAPVAEESIAAATAVLGYDLLQNNINNQATYARTLVRAGLAGSAAALDTRVDIYIGTTVVATLYNVATGAVLSDAHFRDIHKLVPAGAQVRAIVADAPGTNPINIVVEFDG